MYRSDGSTEFFGNVCNHQSLLWRHIPDNSNLQSPHLECLMWIHMAENRVKYESSCDYDERISGFKNVVKLLISLTVISFSKSDIVSNKEKNNFCHPLKSATPSCIQAPWGW
jgi:hypothetical protein